MAGSAKLSDAESLADVNELSLLAYRPPAPKSVREILDADAGDESLRRYKESLLGHEADNVVVDASDARVVILKKITLVTEGRDDITLDINDTFKDISFKIKEGIFFQLRFSFYVQREMVTGLHYFHTISRHGIPVIKEKLMVGSYAPKKELIEYTTPPEEAPAGILWRGKYKVHSKLTDDYKTVFAKWDWTLEISKNW